MRKTREARGHPVITTPDRLEKATSYKTSMHASG